MKFIILLLKTFFFIWIALAFHLVIARLQPFNAKNYLITILTFAPAYGALMLAGRLKKKSLNKHNKSEDQHAKDE